MEYPDIHAFCKDLHINDLIIKYYLLALLMSYEYNEDTFTLDLQGKKSVILKIQLAKILAKLPHDHYADYFEMQDDEEAFLVIYHAFRECLDALPTSLVFDNTSKLSGIEPTINAIWNAIEQAMKIAGIKKPLFRLKNYRGNA